MKLMARITGRTRASNRNRIPTTHRRALVAGATVLASVGVGLVGAAPAQAATTPYFEIYYSPNCTNASRTYIGTNTGEAWINDRYNIWAGSIGYNQLIAYNAASVWIGPNTFLTINYDSNQALQFSKSSTSRCENLSAAYRNYNRNWQVYAG